MERRDFVKGVGIFGASLIAGLFGGKKSVAENIPSEILELKTEPIQGQVLVPPELINAESEKYLKELNVWIEGLGQDDDSPFISLPCRGCNVSGCSTCDPKGVDNGKA